VKETFSPNLTLEILNLTYEYLGGAMKKGVIWAALEVVEIALIGVLGCSKDSSNPYGSSTGSSGAPPPNTVVMMNIAFNPGTLTVSTGTTVTWQNNNGTTHTSTSDNGVWDTGNITGGTSKTLTFSNAGTFKYHCSLHAGMTGTILVQ
jgi:plastocyanin